MAKATVSERTVNLDPKSPGLRRYRALALWCESRLAMRAPSLPRGSEELKSDVVWVTERQA